MDVLGKMKKEISLSIAQELGISPEEVYKVIEYPPKGEMGDLAVPLPALNVKRPQSIEVKSKFVKSSNLAGPFLNLRLDETQLFRELFSSLPQDFGIEKVETPKRIVIEHTSANPIHPLHIGHLRNSILGDALVRLMRARGHEVISRFYVNDSGRQVAILIYGLSKLGYPEPPLGVKKDLWAGTVYAMTNVILEIRTLSDQLKVTKDSEYRELLTKRDEMVGLASNIRSRNQEYFDKLAEAIRDDPDPEGKIAEIIRKYEGGDEETRNIVRRYVNHVLDGFRESLNKLGISFDLFDYESDLVWSGEVKAVLRSALSSQARIEYKGTEALDLNKYMDEEIRKELRIPEGLDIPPLVLTRSDGTTLYTVRDIAYTIRKFLSSKADQVINVIAEQQTVPQIQLRAALYLLGYLDMAKNLIHYSYSMVTLPGMRMSGRLGQYVSLDELYEGVREAVESKTKDRGSQVNIGEIVNSAIRYALLSVSADKPITFNVSKVTNFEQNSGPYLQYTYVRAYNILSKYSGEINLDVDYNDLTGDKRRILISLAKFPETFKISADSLEPEVLVSYLRYLADMFNAWYDKERVIQEPDEKKRMTRLNLVKGVETVMRNGLHVLGISSLTKM
ncbi:arginine--tRNA ligase [Metallosphaera hakonensis]|uniref:Arginine--tRNA ligase n=1 Tax=Metallosphaera hakonensis JCM 8857 = DSM 7519 TaxID=1293036 RepID=A0A2U9IX46_9CREN|nr:arginine--tRNA ligase [Metallosphaera hakonensis]AWS00682.1 arginine--tRNA ligase [Metallosphaera hakonensis JCM 8857 = DSM 7519]